VQNVFDHIDQNWSLGRSIFGILLNNPDSLRFYANRLLAAQTLPASSHAELAARIQSATDELMFGVGANLDHADKDRFQTNLSNFRLTIAAFCTRPI
jgi:hypothetical protein